MAVMASKHQLNKIPVIQKVSLHTILTVEHDDKILLLICRETWRYIKIL